MQDLQTFEFQGCRLAYRLSGGGPPLLMLQGVAVYGASGWNPQVEILEKQYTCLSVDNRGMGASQPPADHLTVNQMAVDTAALMDHIGWPSAHIVGHSLGGLIALQLALNEKRRARSLSLLNTFARGADATRMTPFIIWVGLRMRLGSRSIRRHAFMELVLPPKRDNLDEDAIADTFSRVFGHDVAETPPTVDQQLKAMSAHDVTPLLGKLAGIPTLVISAENDPIAPPRSGRSIASGIPGARYIEIENAGHSFPVLEAERCGNLLLEHLANAESRFAKKAR